MVWIRTRSLRVFHWHGETFTIPPGAPAFCPAPLEDLGVESDGTRLQLSGRFLADTVQLRVASGGLQDMRQALDALHQVADSVYARWVRGLVRV
jgi:hypothetical protein